MARRSLQGILRYLTQRQNYGKAHMSLLIRVRLMILLAMTSVH